MFIPDPDFYPSRHPGSRIPDLGSKNSNKREGCKKFVVIPFFVATNFTKLKLFYFLNSEEKNLGQFSKNYRTLYPKIWDPGSGKNLFRIPDPGPGVKKAPNPGSATML